MIVSSIRTVSPTHAQVIKLKFEVARKGKSAYMSQDAIHNVSKRGISGATAQKLRTEFAKKVNIINKSLVKEYVTTKKRNKTATSNMNIKFAVSNLCKYNLQSQQVQSL